MEEDSRNRDSDSDDQDFHSKKFKTYSRVDGMKFIVPVCYKLCSSIIGKDAICIGTQQIGANEFRNVAIKKTNLSYFPKSYLSRVYREMKITKILNHENVLKLYDHFATEKNCIYEVFEVMDADLEDIIGSRQQLSEGHIKFFLYQILRGLKYIHSAGLVHGNIRSNEILVNSNCDLKISGFQHCVPHNFEIPEDDGYVSTRYYRSPERICQNKYALQASDIWSLGCIVGELFTRKPFFPGRNYLHQIQLILNFTGKPNPEEINGVEKAKHYISTIENVSRNHGELRTLEGLKQQFTQISEDGWDLLSKMLVFDPSKRITAEQALNHNYIQDMRDVPPDEPIFYKKKNNSNDFCFIEEGIQNLDDEDMRKYILHDIFLFNRVKLIRGWDSDMRERVDYLREVIMVHKEEEHERDYSWSFDGVVLIRLVVFGSVSSGPHDRNVSFFVPITFL